MVLREEFSTTALLGDLVLRMFPPSLERLERLKLDYRDVLAIFGNEILIRKKAGHG